MLLFILIDQDCTYKLYLSKFNNRKLKSELFESMLLIFYLIKIVLTACFYPSLMTENQKVNYLNQFYYLF